ncbi:MAG: toll/interleukin-1 receptor domain-containing protein [Thiohalocapsa sp. PB-PSB1]|jgi:hypothetical protein|nr:MAG: hypothetical protein N838_26110 [Thiohalocapsa sp. PB-PSB1]QQO57485.1 MAG: toll/interleukin-1 receptor domain-containing protein [Thiohalocapsa sp. PB-PSB1]
MSVFICYNRNDEAFVDKLSKALVAAHVPVWRDVWQLGLGDSITNSVQDALENSSFVCLVLSKNALESKWVEREITASLVRELEERKLSILPLVIDDCKLPLFLRDKLYADFRKDFDAGVKMILNAVADKYNLYAGKFSNNNKATSFGTDVLLYEKSIEINLDIISEDDDAEYFILTKAKFTGNEKSLEQFKLYDSEGEAGSFVREIIGVCTKNQNIAKAKVVIGGNKPARETFYIGSNEGGLAFKIDISSKKVGRDDGKFVAFHLGYLFRFYSEQFENAHNGNGG